MLKKANFALMVCAGALAACTGVLGSFEDVDSVGGAGGNDGGAFGGANPVGGGKTGGGGAGGHAGTPATFGGGGHAGTGGAVGAGRGGASGAGGAHAGNGGNAGHAGGAGQGGKTMQGGSTQGGSTQGGSGMQGGSVQMGGSTQAGQGGAPPTCGNGAVNGSEQCDGAALQGASCASVTGHADATGALGCTSSCTFDTSGCGFCGNGVIDGDEDCDGATTLSCNDAIGTTGSTGTVKCTGACKLDTSACTCSVVYVSPTGSDANSGCDPNNPAKTITHGIATAKSAPAGTHGEVHICQGTFNESVSLTAQVSLLGSYSCADWTRDAAAYGYPNFTGPMTVINATGGLPPNPTAALTIQSATIKSDTVIDGLQVEGGNGGLGAQTVAVVVSSSSAPTITNDVFDGGSGTDNGGAFGDLVPASSTALSIHASASPDVSSCRITGGSGNGMFGANGNIGSLGVMMGGPGAHIHGNTINGGSGKGSGLGSVGLYMSNSGAGGKTPAPIEQNTINGGTGSLTNAVYLDGAAQEAVTIQLLSNVIDGGSAAARPSDDVPPCAVYADTTQDLHIVGNRISGGTTTASQPGGSLSPCAIGLERPMGTTQIFSNFLHGGTSNTFGTTEGIVIDAPPGTVQVRHNTIHIGSVGTISSVTSFGIDVTTTGGGTLDFTNNLLLGSSSNAAPVSATTCTNGGSFRGNSMVGMSNLGDVCGQAATLGGLEAAFNAKGIGAANWVGQESCGADLRCVLFAGCGEGIPGESCLASVVQNWSSANDGLTTLVTPGSGSMANSVPCEFTQSMAADGSDPTDLNGTPFDVVEPSGAAVYAAGNACAN